MIAKRRVSSPWILAGITLLGLGLRLLQLNVQPLWWDEGYSVFFATRAFPTMLARTAVDIHPPLYYALLRVWMLALGKEDVVLRLLSVLIGILALPLVYVVAHRLFDRRTALLAALLIAIAPIQIYYSQEVRMYGLFTVLALAVIALQIYLFQNDAPPLTAWGAYVIVLTAALYTHYYAAFLVAAQILAVLYLKWRTTLNIRLRAWFVAWAISFLLYLPWLIYTALKLYTYVTAKVGIEQYAILDPFTFLAQHLTAFSVGHLTIWTWLDWGGILFVALALFGIFYRGHPSAPDAAPLRAHRYPLLAIYFFVPVLLGFIVNLVAPFHPFGYERTLLFVMPLFSILVANGLNRLWETRRVLAYGSLVVIVVLSAAALYDFYTVPRYPEEDYRPLIQSMSQLAAPQDLVYAFYPWQIGYLESYYTGAPLNIFEVPGDTWTADPDVMSRDLDALRSANSHAWILAYQTKGRILEDRVTNEYINDYSIADETFGNTRLEYFTRGSTTDFDLPPVAFAPDLELDPQYAAFAASGANQLALASFAWNTPSDQYSYSLRVVDANGNKLAQQDAPIQPGHATVRRALVLNKTPPGVYTLQLVAYHRADGSPLTLPDSSNAVVLAKLTVP